MLAVMERHLHEPKGTVTHGEMLDDFRAQSHLDTLDSGEEQLSQGVVELIKRDGVLECGAGLELMCVLVCLHRTEVGSEAEVTDFAQGLCGKFFVVDDQTLRHQSRNLVGNAQWLFGVNVHVVGK